MLLSLSCLLGHDFFFFFQARAGEQRDCFCILYLHGLMLMYVDVLF